MSGLLAFLNALRGAAGGGGGGFYEFNRWRLQPTSGSGFFCLYELEFRSAVDPSTGIVETASGGTAIAGSFYAPESLVAANAFNGSFAAPRWASNGSSISTAWIGYNFGTPTPVAQVCWSNGSPNTSISNYAIQASMDGVVWADVKTGTAAPTSSSSFDGTMVEMPLAGTEPFFPFVALQLHFDGADASTTFTDTSPLGATATVNGNASIRTAQSVFGGASARFTDYSVNGWITFAANAKYAIGTGDFTVEFRWRRTSSGAALQGIFNIGSFSAGMMIRCGSNGLEVFMLGGGPAFAKTWTNDTWYAIRVTRAAGVLYLHIDGVMVSSVANTSSINPSGSLALLVGASQHNTVENAEFVDELRFIPGVALSTADYTVATEAFADD